MNCCTSCFLVIGVGGKGNEEINGSIVLDRHSSLEEVNPDPSPDPELVSEPLRSSPVPAGISRKDANEGNDVGRWDPSEVEFESSPPTLHSKDGEGGHGILELLFSFFNPLSTWTELRRLLDMLPSDASTTSHSAQLSPLFNLAFINRSEPIFLNFPNRPCFSLSPSGAIVGGFKRGMDVVVRRVGRGRRMSDNLGLVGFGRGRVGDMGGKYEFEDGCLANVFVG